MPVNYFTPSGPGSITDPYYRIRNDRGFFKMLNNTRDDTLRFHTMIDDPIGNPDDNTSYVAWAVGDGYLIDISTALTPNFKQFY